MRILIFALLFVSSATPALSQTLGEVLRAVQNRRLVSEQRDSVYNALVSGTEISPIDDTITYIDWGLGQNFPADSTLDGLSISEKVRLLRLAFEMIQHRHADQLGDGGEIDRLGSPISVENFPVMLKKISRLLKSDTTFDWLLYGKRQYASFAKTGFATPPTSPLTAANTWSHTGDPVISGTLSLSFGIESGLYDADLEDPDDDPEYGYAGSITSYKDIKTKAPSFPGKLRLWADPGYGTNAVEGLTWPYVEGGNTADAFYEPGPHKCVEVDVSAGQTHSFGQLSGIFSGQLSEIKFPVLEHDSPSPSWYVSSTFGSQKNNLKLSIAYGYSEYGFHMWGPGGYSEYTENPDQVWGYSLLSFCRLLSDSYYPYSSSPIALHAELEVDFGQEFSSDLPQIPEEFPQLQVVPDFAKYGFTIPLATSAGNECALVFTSRPTRRFGEVSNEEYGGWDGAYEEYTSRPGLNARSILSVKGTGNWEAIYSGKADDREEELVWEGLYSDQNDRWGNFDDYIAEWWKPVLCQLKTSTCGVEVVQEEAQYKIKFYRLDQVGEKDTATGRFTFSGDPVETFTVAHSTGDDAVYDVTITGSSAEYKIKSSHQFLDDQSAPDMVHWEYTAKDLPANKIILSKTADISDGYYSTEGEFEACKMVENTSVDGGALSTVTTTYLEGTATPTNDKIDKIVEEYSETTRTTDFSYDEDGVLTEIKRTGGPDPYTASYQNRLLTQYVSGPWDIGIGYDGNVVVRTEKYNGTVVRTSRSTYTGNLVSSTTTVDETSDEVTALARYKSGADTVFPWGPDCFRSHDGSLTTYRYERIGDDFVVTTETGRGSTATAETVAAGIRTVAKIAPSGKLISLKTSHIPSNTEIASAVASEYMSDTTFPTAFQTLQGTVRFTYKPTGDVATYTDLLNKQTVYTRDALGRLKSASRSGITASYAYEGLAATVTWGEGKNFSITHGGFGETTGASYQWGGSSGTLEKDDEGYNATSTQSLGNRTVTSATDKYGIPKSSGGTAAEPFDYTIEVTGGRLKTTATHKPGGSSSGIAFVQYTDALGRIRKKEEPSPNGGTATTNYHYTEGRLTSIIDPDGVRTLFEYDDQGKLSTTALDVNNDDSIDPGTDRIIRYVTNYSSAGIETIVKIDEDGSQRTVERRLYKPDSRTLQTDPDGDSSRRITTTSVINSSNHTETITSTSANNLGSAWTVLTDGVPSSGEVSAAGIESHFSAVIDGTEKTWSSVTTWGTGAGTSLTIDPVSGLVTNGTVGDRSFSVDHSTRTGGGVSVAITNSSDKTVTNEYDPRGYLLSSAGFDQTDFTLSAPAVSNGKISQTLTLGGHDTAFSTNLGGGNAVKTHPDDKTEKSTYSNGGRLLTTTNARGQTTTYKRNPIGEVTGIVTPEGAITVTPDAAGQIEAITDKSGTRSLVYDRGRLKTVTYTSGPLSGKSVTRSYDDKGRLSGISLNGAQVTGYGHDGSQLTSVACSGATASYTGTSLPNGIPKDFSIGALSVSKGINTNAELGSINNTAGSLNYNYGYLYDGDGKRYSMTTPKGNWTLGYDTKGHLSSAARSGGSGALAYGYETNAVGNPTSRTVNGVLAGYGAGVGGLNQVGSKTNPNRSILLGGSVAPGAKVYINGEAQIVSPEGLFGRTYSGLSGAGGWFPFTVRGVLENGGDLKADGVSRRDAVAEQATWAWLSPYNEPMSYDADGNRTRDARFAYQWDSANRLITSTWWADSRNGQYKPTIEYLYDSEGRRFQKVVSKNGVLEKTILFVYDGWNLLYEEERNKDGALVATRTYSWGPDISGTVHGAAGVGGLLQITETKGGTTTRSLPLYDGSGNVTGLVDASTGALVAEYEYGPFGETISVTGSRADSCPLRFSSKYYDSETGLYYFGYRYYDPETRSWMSRDPLGEAGGVNLYAYCGNDPANKVDPDGLATMLIDMDLSGDRLQDEPSIGGVFATIGQTFVSNWYETARGLIPDRSGFQQKNTLQAYIDLQARVDDTAELLDFTTPRGLGNMLFAGSTLVGEAWLVEGGAARTLAKASSVSTKISKGLSKIDKAIEKISRFGKEPRSIGGMKAPRRSEYAGTSIFDFSGGDALKEAPFGLAPKRLALPAPKPFELGGGRTFGHFTDAEGVTGIAGVVGESLEIGQQVSVGSLKFGQGRNMFLARGGNDIFITELGADATIGQLNQIGVFGAKQHFLIQFSEEAAFMQGVRPDQALPGRSIYTIPGGTQLDGVFLIQRLR